MSGPPEITQFFGRLHVLLVHLPIGLLVLLALLEVISRHGRFKNATEGTRYILALAVPMAICSVVCGWLLSLGGNYGQKLLQWHFWTGISTAAACSIAALFYWMGRKRLYRVWLGITMIALLVASHFGGSLTHGSDYLVRYAPKQLRAVLNLFSEGPSVETKPKDIKEMQAFADVVQPVLQQNCVVCHGPEKSEADLRLDSLAALRKGGKSGPALVEGKAAESLLIKRIRLPLHEKEHMPPEGKPQPASDQLSLLQWWINAGAPADTRIAELKPPLSILRTLQARYGAPSTVARAVPPRPLDEIRPIASKLADELDMSVSALSPNEPWVQCNASIVGTNFGDAELARLAPLGANLRWLDLGGTKVTYSGLAQVGAMPNLTRLHLERTKITDAGLARLGGLANLEYLNLYGTEVTDAGLAKLEELPRLKQLYLWQTKVTPAAAKAFADSRIDTDQVQRWQDEIDQLKARIKSEQFSMDLGTASMGTTPTNHAAINTQCPVTGKPVDPTKTVIYEGSVVAFCCDDCKEKFEKDAKPFLSKLNLTSTPSAAKAGKP